MKQQRVYIHKLFGTQVALSRQYSIIEGESHRFLQQILSSPDNLADRLGHFSGSIVLRIKYGYTTKDQDDPFIYKADRLMIEFSLAANIGSFPWMVDLFPSGLEKLPDGFPGTHFRKLTKKWSDHLQEFIEIPFQLVKDQMAVGTAVPSFISTILAEGNISSEAEHAIKLVPMAIYAAGSDTMSVYFIFIWFFYKIKNICRLSLSSEVSSWQWHSIRTYLGKLGTRLM